jgi:hypothetical protein
MVRTTQGAVNRYTVGDIPTNAEDIPAFLRRELDKIQAVTNAIQDGQLDVTTVAPTKPRAGMIRYADGVNWLPNGIGGTGIWFYNGASWIQMG